MPGWLIAKRRDAIRGCLSRSRLSTRRPLARVNRGSRQAPDASHAVHLDQRKSKQVLRLLR